MQRDISPRLALLAATAALLALLSSGCADAATAPAPGTGLDGTWHAAQLAGANLPATLYHFDPEEVNGELVSVHIVLDSARLRLLPGGGYIHRVWVSEWHGQPGGAPEVLRLRFSHYDHGGWERAATAIHLESGYLQNHRIDGTVGASSLELQHGFSHGDEERHITYRRAP